MCFGIIEVDVIAAVYFEASVTFWAFSGLHSFAGFMSFSPNATSCIFLLQKSLTVCFDRSLTSGGYVQTSDKMMYCECNFWVLEIQFHSQSSKHKQCA
jgi:hypothetical protein